MLILISIADFANIKMKTKLAILLQLQIIQIKLLLFLLKKQKLERLRKKRRWWIRPILADRENKGIYHLYKEATWNQGFTFRHVYRVSPETFGIIVAATRPYLERRHHVPRKAIAVEERLAVTLRYLATGNYL